MMDIFFRHIKNITLHIIKKYFKCKGEERIMPVKSPAPRTLNDSSKSPLKESYI